VPRVIGGSLETHRDVTRERIFDAFARLMYEQGYDSISLADVAAASGLARTAMYNYFGDKESLLIAYAGRETARYVAQLHDALAAVDGPVAALQAYVRSQIAYFAEHHLPPGPALRHMLPPTAFEEMLDHVRALDDELHGILTEGHEARYLVADDVTGTAALINACIARASALHENGYDLDSAADLAETFLLRALGVRLDRDGNARRLPRTRPRS